MTTHTHRLVALFGALLLLAGCSAEVSGKRPEGATPVDGKLDSFRAPTEHGVIPFGERIESAFTEDERFHAWDFELSAESSVKIETSAVGRSDVDTVIYLYLKQEDGRWGRYIARNDDDGRDGFSQLSETWGPGSYRIMVKHYDRTGEGAFAIRATCEGAGCDMAPPPTTETVLRVPLLDDSDYTAMARHNDAIVAAGHTGLPVYVEVTPNDAGADVWREMMDQIDVLADEVEGVGYAVGYALPADYDGTHEGAPVSMCYTGDAAAIVDGTYALGDAVFSDQLTVWGWRYGNEEGLLEDYPVDLREFPAEWHDFDVNSGDILLVVATSDSGFERDPQIIERCGEAPAPTLDVQAITSRVLGEALVGELPFEISTAEVLEQADRFDGLSYEIALRSAIWSFLNDGDNIESPISIVSKVDEGPCLSESNNERVRCFANRPSAKLTLLSVGDTPEGGEQVADAWIFRLDLDELSDHLFWAVVDREGVEPTFNYGFN